MEMISSPLLGFQKPLSIQMEKHSFPEKWEVEHCQDVTSVCTDLCLRTKFKPVWAGSI